MSHTTLPNHWGWFTKTGEFTISCSSAWKPAFFSFSFLQRFSENADRQAHTSKISEDWAYKHYNYLFNGIVHGLRYRALNKGRLRGQHVDVPRIWNVDHLLYLGGGKCQHSRIEPNHKLHGWLFAIREYLLQVCLQAYSTLSNMYSGCNMLLGILTPWGSAHIAASFEWINYNSSLPPWETIVVYWHSSCSLTENTTSRELDKEFAGAWGCTCNPLISGAMLFRLM